MILVEGVPFPSDSSSSPSSSSSQVFGILAALMSHPSLLSASRSFKDTVERRFSVSEESALGTITRCKCVYVFQREYATVDPTLVDFTGTDEATTCVGIVIRNRNNGKISVAHMDSPTVVEIGMTQMLLEVRDQDLQAEMDVHLIGGFEDASTKQMSHSYKTKIFEKMDGYSLPLCLKIIEELWKRQEKFHVQTLFVLGHNTRRDAEGCAYPIVCGFLVETSTGSVFPACFDKTARCPDEIVRQIRVTACNDDPGWRGKLLETYDTKTDRFKIACCCWSRHQQQIALARQQLSDSQILLSCSTSPSAEGPDFVDTMRRKSDYLIAHPDWRETFPRKQPRVFERIGQGGWRRC